ncbi:hypothetical protein LSH36_600g01078 [Paralvinella palmiformis]|uniref:Uncharacterized protein n=1 Tax=Paralvinella palmiformis TaxID=53620 RepID=A0AAD9MWD1_9ANNE|nr:hypothetical protein LSH36_600g01078 [Paralvinella palmiformis]
MDSTKERRHVVGDVSRPGYESNRSNGKRGIRTEESAVSELRHRKSSDLDRRSAKYERNACADRSGRAPSPKRTASRPSDPDRRHRRRQIQNGNDNRRN